MSFHVHSFAMSTQLSPQVHQLMNSVGMACDVSVLFKSLQNKHGICHVHKRNMRNECQHCSDMLKCCNRGEKFSLIIGAASWNFLLQNDSVL